MTPTESPTGQTNPEEPVDADRQVKIIKSLWEPHPGQQAVMQHPARFRIAACGRRWGKSEMCAHIALERALAEPERLVWWVAPTYDDANDYGFDKIIPLLSPDVLAGSPKRTKPREITINNGSTISFRSADREDSLRGAGVDLLIIDESGAVPGRAWKEELRPTLTDTQGDLVAIGTPKAGGWFYEWWKRGQSGEHDDVASWQAPTAQNPHIDSEEIEAAKRELPEATFRQEYRAEFEAGGKRLRRDMLHFIEPGDIEAEELRYRVGVDLAIEQSPTKARERDLDYTAVALLAVAPGGQGYLVDAPIRRRGMSLTKSIEFVAGVISDIPRGMRQILVEDNAAQSWWVDHARSEYGLDVQGVTSTRPKEERILFLSVPFSNEDILIVDHGDNRYSEFIQEWMGWDGSGSPDRIDAVELATRGLHFGEQTPTIYSGDPWNRSSGVGWTS